MNNVFRNCRVDNEPAKNSFVIGEDMNCHGLQEVDMEPKRIKPGWLTQDKIDHAVDLTTLTIWQKIKNYFDGPPGGLACIVLSAVIVLAILYWLYCGWTASDAVITAIKG